ncbi:hypothetical protein RRF57_001880 [Xylaria bambusicola]|uniref:Uncharacterized protein n=1 Tax=Xylaria bambusicola TaxID=326684 RepID=A0AAN7YV81_9PEZI
MRKSNQLGEVSSSVSYSHFYALFLRPTQSTTSQDNIHLGTHTRSPGSFYILTGWVSTTPGNPSKALFGLIIATFQNHSQPQQYMELTLSSTRSSRLSADQRLLTLNTLSVFIMSSHHNSPSSTNDGGGIHQGEQNVEMSGNNNPSANGGGNDNHLASNAGTDEDPQEGSDEDDPSVDPNILFEDGDDDDDDGGSDSERRSGWRNAKAKSAECKAKCEALKKECDDIKKQWLDEVNNLRQQHAIEVRELKDKIKKLEEELRLLRESGVLTWVPWENDLFRYLEWFRNRDSNEDDSEYPIGYHKIYHESCRQGNMSLTLTHPDLHIEDIMKTRAEINEHFATQESLNGHNAALNAPFSFEKLPVTVQCKIWRLIVPNRKLIHCLSRLDPKNPPIADYLSGRRRKYPSRFHIGNGPCCVALADKPSTYLDYFCVSKRWFYALAHLFYATNTFAFSSLGELGRFFDGIGRARTERVVNIELLWQGGLTPRQPRGKISLRKSPLSHFMFTSRLRTLVVHIDESSRSRMRRSYEMKENDDYYRDFDSEEYEDHEAEDNLDMFQMEAQRTDLQQNYRKYRSMRTVHGMDYIYELRGMKWVHFYDIHAARPFTYIRDKSFLCDINNSQ